MRTETEAAGETVGFIGKHGGDAEILRADAHHAARCQMQAVEQRLFGNGAADVRFARKRLIQRGTGCPKARGESDVAVQRIGAIDGFQFDQLARAARSVCKRIGHRAHRGGL